MLALMTYASLATHSLHSTTPVAGRMSSFPQTRNLTQVAASTGDSGCVLSTLDAPCDSDHPQRFENGDGYFKLPHSAFIGKGGPGHLEVPPGEAACCVAAGGLYINPPPGAPMPAACDGTGSVVFPAVLKFQLLYWMDYTNDCAPPKFSNQSCTALGGPNCIQKSCLQCPAESDCYCVPLGICSTPNAPAEAC
jgi:hypothetical protein